MVTNGRGQVLELRKEIDELLGRGAAPVAYRRLGELWRQEQGQASAAFVVSRCEKLRGQLSFTPFRLAILRSFTVEPAIILLRAAAFLSGIDLQVQVGDFNAYPQEILDSNSSLYKFSPDAVILAAQACDVAPDLWNAFADLSSDAAAAAVQRVVSSYRQWARAFRERSQATLIVHTLEQPSVPALGVLDAQSPLPQRADFEQINQQLRTLNGELRGVFLLDYDALVARHGRTRWRDQRKWLTSRMPIVADQLIHLAHEWLRFLVPLSGRTAKALVVDLDNTLWGGVIGEDGMTGIKLSAEYPGASYQALQRAMLDLSKKGILLAICSKNNPEDAMEALEHHPGMLLRPQHFAAMRINWNDKAQNLREIAAELNIGIDSIAFLDDNPVERESVRATVPEVTVIDLPEHPVDYAAALRDCPVFERLTLSQEDRERTVLYAAERERSHVQQTFASKEDFFRFLEQEAEVAPVAPATLARVSQLTQKTNQFNLTTHRYTEQQIADLAAVPDAQVTSIRVRDRYGDHGLVGVAITRDQGEDCEIDTFLLSCRVIGRTVETALLAHLAEQARARGRRRMFGRFLPTRKNAPARDFYSRHGFQLQSQNGEGSLWVLDLAHANVPRPEWIKINITNGGKN
jgi:FkbH-like protein